jgi:response regulator RpfG family c-di-GMP phosphodiesterase
MKSRVIFVDDDPFILAGLRRQLLRQLPEVELLFCNSGQQALAEAETKPPVLLITDGRMPEMDGPELLAQFAAQFPATERWALTGCADSDETSRIAALTSRIFHKPHNAEEIATQIRQLLGLSSL